MKQPSQIDWRASFSEHSGSFDKHKLTAFDTQSVTIQYFQDDASMTGYLVPGSPYMTFSYKGATPLLTSQGGAIQSFNGKTLANGDSCMYFPARYLQRASQMFIEGCPKFLLRPANICVQPLLRALPSPLSIRPVHTLSTLCRPSL